LTFKDSFYDVGLRTGQSDKQGEVIWNWDHF
jgi:hypothetical protein